MLWPYGLQFFGVSRLFLSLVSMHPVEVYYPSSLPLCQLKFYPNQRGLCDYPALCLKFRLNQFRLLAHAGERREQQAVFHFHLLVVLVLSFLVQQAQVQAVARSAYLLPDFQCARSLCLLRECHQLHRQPTSLFHHKLREFRRLPYQSSHLQEYHLRGQNRRLSRAIRPVQPRLRLHQHLVI